MIEKAKAVFIGYQEMFNEPAKPLFNIEGNHPRSGSSVFPQTLKQLKIPIPRVPSYKMWNRAKLS